MGKRLLFINQRQFGYHITYLKFCTYLKTDFNITYLCWDNGNDKFLEDGIEIIYIPRQGNLILRNIRFFKVVLKHIKNRHYHYIFVNYYRGCSLIPIFFNKKCHVHLNIVSGSVSSNSISRRMYNLLLCIESYFYKSVSVISDGLQRLLKVTSDAYILPLGADPLILNKKPEHKLSLLYVGTFYNRRIDETITGLGLFLKKYPNSDIRYTIIGDGLASEIEQIKIKIKIYELENHVELIGYIRNNDLNKYFIKANVGVSYIPISRYFTFQPATKTYEYLMAGMPVIATGTFANRKIINEQNGIIIFDNPASFSQGLELLYERIDNYNETLIRISVDEYKWETIVSKLKDYIISLSESGV